eukprot:gene10323-12668_t
MWRIEQCSNEPHPRCAHQADSIDDYLYVFGGWTDENKMLNDMHRFNVETWEWEELIPKNNSSTITDNNNSNNTNNTITIEPRNGHSLNAYNRKLILFGGGSFSGFLNDINIFDPETLLWEKIQVEGKVPSGRSKHSSSLVGSRLYIFGGGDGIRLYNDLFYLDLETMVWEQVEVKNSKPPPPRWGHSMVKLEGGKKLLLFGGHSGTKRLNDIFIFDTELCEWSQPTLHPDSEIPNPRAGHSASIIGNHMVLFCGGDGHILNDFYGLDSTNWRWWKITSTNVPGDDNIELLYQSKLNSKNDDLSNKTPNKKLSTTTTTPKKINENSNNINSTPNNKISTTATTPNTNTTTTTNSTTTKNVLSNIPINEISKSLSQLPNTIKTINEKSNNNNNIIPQQNNIDNNNKEQSKKDQILNNHKEPEIIIVDQDESKQSINLEQEFQKQVIVTNHQIQQQSNLMTPVKKKPIDKLLESCLTDREKRDIKYFLNNIGMSKFVNKFIEEEIDTSTLYMLNEDHLKSIGITSLGDRLTIIKGIRESTLYLFKGLPPLNVDYDSDFLIE